MERLVDKGLCKAIGISRYVGSRLVLMTMMMMMMIMMCFTHSSARITYTTTTISIIIITTFPLVCVNFVSYHHIIIAILISISIIITSR